MMEISKKFLSNYRLNSLREWLKSPLSSYYLVVGLTVFFSLFGIVMVASASYVTSYTDSGSLYSEVFSQFIFLLVGAGLFMLTMCIPIRLIQTTSFLLLLVTIAGLVLVLIPGIGVEINESKRWIALGSLTFQPSEFVKLALCVWGANILSLRISSGKAVDINDLLLPFLPITGLICILIILEPNYSTTMIIALIALILLWYAGLSYRILFMGVVITTVLGLFFALTKEYRSSRITSFFNPGQDPLGQQYQITQSKFAFANGGFWGTGLGNGEAKYLYLPNSHNDFLFAVIGEELGLVGCGLVLILFFCFAIVGFRIAAKSIDPFIKLLAATITSLLVIQALLNIGYTVGILPVTGVQLPLLSAGGTATLSTLIMCGLLASAARHEPEAIAAISIRHAESTSRFKLPVPKPYLPSVDKIKKVNVDSGRRSDNHSRLKK